MAPVRWALFSAPFPRTTVSRWEEPPWVLLPILVTVSQSSAMVCEWNRECDDVLRGRRWDVELEEFEFEIKMYGKRKLGHR
jgi:hypothetical protein